VLDERTYKPVDDRLSRVGQPMIIYPIHIPPTMDNPGVFGRSSIQAISTTYDPENFRVAWKTNTPLPEWLFRAERWQELTEVGDGKTKYENFEVFYGPLSYLLEFFFGNGLKLGAIAMAEGLKKRAEES
jgi:hypothetical protein